nr:glycoside hydrolase family 10 xylanase precursor [uncultured bacterium]
MIQRSKHLLSLLLIIPALLLTACGETPVYEYDGESLRELADEVGINFGTAIGEGAVGGVGNEYTMLLHAHFNHATPENSMKWQPLLNQGRGNYTWTNADKFVTEASESEQRIRGHALIWHSQNPSWLDNGTWTAEQLRTLMDEHFAALATRYGDSIYSWDVVNEAFDGNPVTHRNESIWYTTIGNSYIAEAFTKARTHFPNARLYYNDFNINGGTTWTMAKADRVYQMAQELVNTNVHIDGIGFQMHLQLDHGFNVTTFKQNLQRFIDLGLCADITELDIRIKTPVTAAKLNQQATMYADILRAYLELDRDYADTFIVWGISDDKSWIPYTFSGYDDALLFDKQRNPKPAVAALIAVLEEWVE